MLEGQRNQTQVHKASNPIIQKSKVVIRKN